jgi:hypothetical protein
VFGHQERDGVSAEGPASAAGEERVAWFSSTLGQPGSEDATRLGGEGCDPLLASFAVAAHVGRHVPVDTPCIPVAE